MATFNVTLVVDRNTVPGTLIHRGEVISVGPYTPNNGSHHPSLLLIHVRQIPVNYATKAIAKRKLKKLMEEPHRDRDDIREVERNRQFRVRIGRMTDEDRASLMRNKEISMTWTKLKTLLGKRILGARNLPETDTYALFKDTDL